MADTEGRIVITRDPPAQANGGKFAAAAANAKATGEQIRQRRQQIHTQARADASAVPIAPPPDLDPPPVRENLESVTFTAPNGMEIEYGPRTDISLTDRIARMYSGRDHSVTEFRITRVLMGVRSINGVPPTAVVDEITRTKLANHVGDEVIDLLLYFDRVNWPPLQQNELPVLKKKLRT